MSAHPIRSAVGLFAAGLLCRPAGAAQAPPKTPKPASVAPKTPKLSRPAGFASLRSRYVATFFKRFPVVATYFGAEGLDPAFAVFNGRLRDYSADALRAERQEWLELQGALGRVDRTVLSDAERVDAGVMASQLAFLLRNLDRRIHEKALDVFVEEPFRAVEWSFQGMTPDAASGALGTRAEWVALADRVASIPAYLKTALVNVRRGAASGVLPDRRLIALAASTAETTVAYFEKSLVAEAPAAPPEAAEPRARLLAAAPAAAAAYRDFRKGLADLYFEADGATLKKDYDRDRFALGAEEYAWAVKNNFRLEKPPRELHALGKRAVLGSLQAMQALAGAVAAERSLPSPEIGAVLAKLAEEAPKDDDAMLDSYRAACARLVAYGRASGLFAPPADYKLDVVFTPAPLRNTVSASYYPAPAFKSSGVGRFYVTPTGNDPNRLRRHARASVAALAAHEGFPGHDWHFQLMRSRAAAISPVRWLTPGGVEDSASMWADSMAHEGWALYAEELVGEPRVLSGETEPRPHGFYAKEEKLLQLQAQLLRDARVVVDTGIHTGLMTFDDAVTYFAKNVLFVKGMVTTDAALNPSATERSDVESARRAIARYARWPTQAITYSLGKAEIKALRDEVRAIEGAAFDERRFHEELLTDGTIPVGAFREAFLSRVKARSLPTAAPASSAPAPSAP